MTRPEKLRCPKCERDGVATWDEGSEPRGRNTVRALVGLTAGFNSVDKGGRGGPAITCAGCGGRISSN